MESDLGSTIKSTAIGLVDPENQPHQWSDHDIATLLNEAADRIEALERALQPFAAIAAQDIGEDEADSDMYRPMFAHNRAPRLTVGDLRRARALLGDATP